MRSSTSSAADRVGPVLRALAKDYGDAHCALEHSSALELLVATILSAQCTDARVNVVTRALFKKYRSARDYAEADLKALEQDVRSTGFYRNKARNIQGAARVLVEKHAGRVPESMDALLELPGVARKTANVVLGTWFKKTTGVVVDTHVLRISRRLGFTRHEDPKKIEQDLQKLLPSKDWIDFSHRVIWHGRKVCSARKPKCSECSLASCCPSAGTLS
jgi:endonuclease-3